jgi:hypothetical protein
MSRFSWTIVVSLTVLVAGCKSSDSPRVDDDTNGKSDPQVKKPETQNPKTPKPEQPPVSGQPDVAKADRIELIQCLGHEDTTIRLDASDRLLAQGSDAIPLLIATLEDDNYHVRAGAVFSLGQFGPQAKSASAKLEELANDDEWEVVRDAATFAIQSINGN